MDRHIDRSIERKRDREEQGERIREMDKQGRGG